MNSLSISSPPSVKQVAPAFSGHRNPSLPVIKFDNLWNVIEVNSSGIDFLDKIGGFLSEIPPSILLSNHPSISDPDCCTDICVTIGSDNYYFSAVAFKEAGYVGLYAYSIIFQEAARTKAA